MASPRSLAGGLGGRQTLEIRPGESVSAFPRHGSPRSCRNNRRRWLPHSLEAGTACSAAWKPTLEWVPSQNGFVVDAPQRHRAMTDLAG